MFRVSVFGLRLNAGGIETELGGSLVVEWVTKMSHNGTMDTSASRAHNFIIFFGVFISENGWQRDPSNYCLSNQSHRPNREILCSYVDSHSEKLHPNDQ